LLVNQDEYFPYEFRELNRWVPNAVAVSEAFADGAATKLQLWAARSDRGGPHDIALENAPDSDGTFFKVPKVIER